MVPVSSDGLFSDLTGILNVLDSLEDGVNMLEELGPSGLEGKEEAACLTNGFDEVEVEDVEGVGAFDSVDLGGTKGRLSGLVEGEMPVPEPFLNDCK